MNAFIAMVIDSYRELNAKKLFWVTLMISALVTVVYASIGFSQDGMFLFFGLTTIESDILVEGSPMARILYRGIFSTFIVGIWLAWIATILAIISTTTIFPDFVAGGSIDLVLSKPIRRLTLFIMKYLSSLLFVVVQVLLFCIGVFICMGWRLGEWDPMIFSAVPIITVFFTYLFCINVLVGVVTRSALAALLATLLFWFMLFSLNTAHVALLQTKLGWEQQISQHDVEIGRLEAGMATGVLDDEEVKKLSIAPRLAAEKKQRESVVEAAATLEKWHRPIRWTLAILPKTDRTVGLLDRWLVDDSDTNLMDLLSGNVQPDGAGGFKPTQTNPIEDKLIEEMTSQSPFYLIATSLGFELVILGIAAFVFVRRDY